MTASDLDISPGKLLREEYPPPQLSIPYQAKRPKNTRDLWVPQRSSFYSSLVRGFTLRHLAYHIPPQRRNSNAGWTIELCPQASINQYLSYSSQTSLYQAHLAEKFLSCI